MGPHRLETLAPNKKKTDRIMPARLRHFRCQIALDSCARGGGACPGNQGKLRRAIKLPGLGKWPAQSTPYHDEGADQRS
eukprot:140442-Pyramimonas_sp.AAC.1